MSMKSEIPSSTSGEFPVESRVAAAKVDPSCALADALKKTSERLAQAEDEAQAEKLRAAVRLSDFYRERMRGAELQADLIKEHERAEKLEAEVARVEQFCKTLETHLLAEKERLQAALAAR